MARDPDWRLPRVTHWRSQILSRRTPCQSSGTRCTKRVLASLSKVAVETEPAEHRNRRCWHLPEVVLAQDSHWAPRQKLAVRGVSQSHQHRRATAFAAFRCLVLLQHSIRAYKEA